MASKNTFLLGILMGSIVILITLGAYFVFFKTQPEILSPENLPQTTGLETSGNTPLE